jgi:hypothetical protein
MAARMWRWGTQAVSPASVLMVNIVSTPPQRPLSASLTVSVAILMVGLQKPYRASHASSLTCFPTLASTIS